MIAEQYINFKLSQVIYMAPEALSGNSTVSSDIWACGIMMHYLLTRKFPFDGENEKALIYNIKTSQPDICLNQLGEEAAKLIKSMLKFKGCN